MESSDLNMEAVASTTATDRSEEPPTHSDSSEMLESTSTTEFHTSPGSTGFHTSPGYGKEIGSSQVICHLVFVSNAHIFEKYPLIA